MLALSDFSSRCAPVFDTMPINRAFLFGSYAREEQTEYSDVDIAYERQEGAHFGFASFLAFKHALEAALGLQVDLHEVPTAGTSRSQVFLEEFQRDGRLIYER